MSDSITKITKNSYGSRLKNSLGKIFGGILFIIGAIVLLARNEHNSIEQKRALNEGAELVQEGDCTQIDTNLDKKEVHMVGETFSNAEELKDETFGIVTNDLKLARTVQMYQRQEIENQDCSDNYGGSESCSTTYSYEKVRNDYAIDSSSFQKSAEHQNPTNWQFESANREKTPILLGKFTLTNIFVNSLNDYKKLNLTNNENINTNGGIINNDHIYIGEDENNPQIGDLKITFSTVKTGTISIIGMQYDDTLTSFTTSNNRSIALIEDGKVPAETMFANAQKANKILTRILRFAGLFIMFLGFCMIFELVETLMKVLPFLANIIGVGTKIIALGLTITLGFLTIGLAWIAVRPVVGISCLIIAALGIFLLIKYRKNKKSGNSDKSQKISKGGNDFEIVENKKGNSNPDDAEIIEC